MSTIHFVCMHKYIGICIVFLCVNLENGGSIFFELFCCFALDIVRCAKLHNLALCHLAWLLKVRMPHIMY